MTKQKRSEKRETKRIVVFNTADNQIANISVNLSGYPFNALTISMIGNNERDSFVLGLKHDELKLLKTAIELYETGDDSKILKISQ